MKDLYNLIDQQLLSLLNAWADVHERLMDDSLQIPDDGYDRWDSGDDVPDIALMESEREMLDGIELASRNLINSAEDANLISLDDWRTINAILCNIGSEEPHTAAMLWWRGADEADDGNPPLCSQMFPLEAR